MMRTVLFRAVKNSIFIAAIVTVASAAYGQKIKLSGVVYDPHGSLVVGATVSATNSKGKLVSVNSGRLGSYQLELEPGIYAIDVASDGFLTIKYKEFLVVNSTNGTMSMDFVLFGGKYHEPCGFSGADCLPAKSLIRFYKVEYTPKLKEIVEEFSPDIKKTREQ
jgi:hypothetical protein